MPRNARTADVLARIGVYMGKQVEPLTDEEKAEVWSTVAMWCEGDIQDIGYAMNDEGEYVKVEDADPYVAGDGATWIVRRTKSGGSRWVRAANDD